MCECGIIPVVRSLLRKGLPVSVGVVLILAVPVVNPVVAVSTFMAFGRHPAMVAWRLGSAYLIAVSTGILIGLLGRRTQTAVQPVMLGEAACAAEDHDEEGSHGPVRSFLAHLGEEFFEIVQRVIGAFLSAVVQAAVSRAWLAGMPYGSLLAVPFMMLLALYEGSLQPGATVEVAGMVVRPKGQATDRIYLCRFVVSCCAADAMPVGIIVTGEGVSRLEDGSWAEVRGRAVPRDGPQGTPLLEAVVVKGIPVMGDPYIYQGNVLPFY